MAENIPDEETLYGAGIKGSEVKLARDLSFTFDGIARTAMRASAEFADMHNDIGVVSKIRKAHSVITLLIDDAMRGLNEATMTALSFATLSALEPEDPEPDDLDRRDLDLGDLDL